MKKLRRILALMMALILALSMTAVTVSADEGYTPTDSYVLGYETGTNKWQYFSPYIASWKFQGVSDSNNLISFTLRKAGSEVGFPVYCTDIDTGLKATAFQRINLEDSTYYASGAAGVLRSIVLNGFPNKTVSELGAAAGVENLTVGEAVSATQAAIWKTAHGDSVEFTDFVYEFDTEWGETATVNYADCMVEINNGYATAENEEKIESHIAAVYNYLIGLSPTNPSGVAVSNASFKDWSEEPTVTKKEDGTYDVTVTATVNVAMDSNDALTLTAYMAGNTGYYSQVPLSDGSNTEMLTINVPTADIANGDVKLAIDGTQTVSDVFLFDAEGNRKTSQSLIGINNSQLPVHAEITVQTERIFNIVKKSGGGTKLKGITFDIFFAGTLSDYLNGKVNLTYSKSGLGAAVYTIVTDKDGKGSFNLTKNNMPDGVYLVVEKDHPSIVAPCAPFYFTLPATNEDGTGLVYEITAYPKNTVDGSVDIEKDVIELGNDEASVDAYAPHTWIISATIPGDIAIGESYVISDTLDNRLDYLGNVKVQIETVGEATEEGKIVAEVKDTLIEGVDYVLTESLNDSLAEEKPSDSFTVSLNASGMVKAAKYATNDYRIRVYFDAQINANAAVSQVIPNKATIDYTNSFDMDYTDTSDEPIVYTAGVKLTKVDAYDETKLLEGAVFTLYRPATEEEETSEHATTIIVNGAEVNVVPAKFAASEMFTDVKVSTVTTGTNGLAYMYGLANGTYYLVETKAPAGYNLATDPTVVEINAGVEKTETESGLTETVTVKGAVAEVKVTNAAGTILPETGGMGTTVIYAAGLALIGAAVAMLLMKKRGTC